MASFHVALFPQQPLQQRLLRMQPVAGFLEDDAAIRFEDVVGNFLAAMGGKAVHDFRVGRRQLQELGVHLVRLESLVQMASSLSQAVRRYQNPAIADLLDGEISAAGASRDWLRQHVSDLSILREKELSVAEQEAQKCRAQTLHQGNRK